MWRDVAEDCVELLVLDLPVLELALDAVRTGRSVSSQVLTYAERRIVPFEPHTPALRRRQADLRRLMDGVNYGSQQELLEQIHQSTGEDVFVAVFIVYQDGNDGGRQVSMATWSEGVDTVLPMTESHCPGEAAGRGRGGRDGGRPGAGEHGAGGPDGAARHALSAALPGAFVPR